MMLAAASQALQLNVTPGSLRTHLPALVNTQDNSVELKGSANVTDLALLRQMSRTVTTLDMSDLSIEAYTYPEGDYYGSAVFGAGEIPPYMLAGSAVSVFRFPAGVTSIGESAFAGSNLMVTTIPATVVSVGDYAYAACKRLTAVRFLSRPDLGAGMFKDCSALTNVDIPYVMTDIPESMFDGCVSYAVAPPEDVRSVGAYAYRGTAVEVLCLTQASALGDYCFADMPCLREIDIDLSDNIRVGTGAFYNDTALGMLPSWPGDMPDLVLAYSRGMQKQSFSSEVIGEAALANNADIGYVALGSGVRRIMAHAFRNLVSLEQVDVRELGQTMPDVDVSAFSGLENSDGRYDIVLNVAKETNDVWKEHPVWGLFDIKNMDTGIGSVPDAVSVSISIVRDGENVVVTSSEPVDYLGVFALDGTVLQETSPGVCVSEVTVSGHSDVVVVKAISAGREKIVKLR